MTEVSPELERQIAARLLPAVAGLLDEGVSKADLGEILVCLGAAYLGLSSDNAGHRRKMAALLNAKERGN